MSTDVEHASLRQEILDNGSHAVNVANIVVTLTGVAIVAAFQFRNPYVALLPLFVLFYGHIVLFNNTQTIARNSVYLRLVEHERYERVLYALRIKILARETANRARSPWIIRWLVPHSVLWESWIAPILQNMFIALGFVCIIFFGLVAWLVETNPNTAPNASPDLILPPQYNIGIAIIVSIMWLLIAIRSRRVAQPLFGKGNMIQQFEAALLEITSEGTTGKTVE